MDEKQLIQIPLEEYLELQELKKHEKMVKIEEFYTTENASSKRVFTGSTVSWKSDGKCWMNLSSKLSSQGDLVKELVKEKKVLEDSVSMITMRMETHRSKLDSLKGLNIIKLYFAVRNLV